VASLPSAHLLAWDCATGNGQAARGLASRFQRVIATDASAEQIGMADPRPGIEFRVAPADSSGLPDCSVDLVTAAQALHWFDAHAFFREAGRVLSAGGAIAVWGYGDPVLDSPVLQRILHGFNRATIESYWLPERQLLLDGYRDIEFPFREVAVPRFTLERRCNLANLMGYVRTWSATARFVADHGLGEVERLESELASHWGSPDNEPWVRAPLFLRAGYKLQ
jgi:SAM-dependent methyltransferase